MTQIIDCAKLRTEHEKRIRKAKVALRKAERTTMPPRFELPPEPAGTVDLMQVRMWREARDGTFDATHYPWRMLTCCQLLNLTSWKQVSRVVPELFSIAPTPHHMAAASVGDIEPLLRPLGLSKRRSLGLIKFSDQYCYRRWEDVAGLHGVGMYALHSWMIFVEGMTLVNPSDRKLRAYCESCLSMAEEKHPAWRSDAAVAM